LCNNINKDCTLTGNSTHEILATFEKLAVNGANLVMISSVLGLYTGTRNKGKNRIKPKEHQLLKETHKQLQHELKRYHIVLCIQYQL